MLPQQRLDAGKLKWGEVNSNNPTDYNVGHRCIIWILV